MRIWYDTEFIDNGVTIELLSIGMVREDGKTYYAVVQDLNLMLKAYNLRSPDGTYWLRNNVLNSLPLKYDSNDRIFPVNWDSENPEIWSVKPRDFIAKEIKAFCTEHGTPELWAWFSAYDHVALSQLFGRMLDLPSDMPMYTMDLKQEHHRLGFPRLSEQLAGNHNALADAYHNVVIWKTLKEYSDRREW